MGKYGDHNPYEADNPPEEEFRTPGAEAGEPEEPRGRPVGEDGNYRGAGTAPEGECLTCGADVPRGQEQCSNCRRKDADPYDESLDTRDELEPRIVQTVFAAVPARSKYFAAAKGGVALDEFPGRARGVDSVHPVYDFDGEPVDLLTDRWGDLPEVCQLDSKAGQRLLEQLRTAGEEGTGEADTDEPSVPLDAPGVPGLVDAAGEPIDPADDVDATVARIREQTIAAAPLQEDEDATVWLMPALALQSEGWFEHRVTTKLRCRHCKETTVHGYEGRGGGRIPEFDEPIWTCRECRGRRSGPSKETVENRGPKSDRERAREMVAEFEINDPDDGIRAGTYYPPDA